MRQDILRAIKQTDDSSILAELKLAKAVLEGHGPGGDLLKLLKQPTPALLKLLLGQHCNVMTLQVSSFACSAFGSLLMPAREGLIVQHRGRDCPKKPEVQYALPYHVDMHGHETSCHLRQACSMMPSLRGLPRTVVQRKEAIKLKEEYHTFRDRSGVILFALASVLLLGLLRADAKRKAGEPFSLTPPFMVGVQAFLAWLLYFYTALALRENVLKVREAGHMLSQNYLLLLSCPLFSHNPVAHEVPTFEHVLLELDS